VFWGGVLRFKFGQTTSGRGHVTVVSWNGPGCTGSTLVGVGGSEIDADEDRGHWVEVGFGGPNSGWTVPAGTKSVELSARVQKYDAGGLLTLNADKLFIARVGSPVCDGQVPTLLGTDAGETLVGTPGTDVIHGMDGPDRILGGGGFDTLCGGEGADTLKGGTGPDVLLGGPDGDRLRGGGGADALFGGEGIDVCAGGAGTDEASDTCETTSGIP
jgi:Ca2+-binding RTX toxin-like protein